ncbi:MAG: DUF418 domain-containing protein [Nannocystaceae bacterium]
MSGERWPWLDGLRGVALGGIALVNLTWFTGYAVLDEAARAALPTAALDPAVRTVIHVLVDAKLYSLFALLLGIGYGLLAPRLRPGGWHRRMGVLLMIGAAHASLLWFGDILSLYALVGSLLPLSRALRPRGLLVAALVCLGAPVVQYGIAAPAGVELGPAASLGAFGEGRYPEMLRANAAFLQMRWILAFEEGRLFKIAGMVLLGIYAVRQGLVARPRAHRSWLGCVALVGLVVGLPLELYRALAEPDGVVGVAVAALGVPALALAYAAAFAMRPCTWLAPVGRMSLTNYLMQSLLGIAVFYGCGLGAWGSVGPTLIVPLAGIQLWAQVRLSRWWLRHFERGPAEALWRRLAASGRSASGGASRSQ